MINNSQIGKSVEKLSSGLRINRAGDDAAGLSISEKMRGQIRGLRMASRNSQDAISLIQTAEGALTESHSILHRMRDLVLQAASTGPQTEDEFDSIQEEITQLQDELTAIAERTQFNGKNLLDGTFAAGSGGTDLVFHIGANEGQRMVLNIGDMRATALGGAGSGAQTVDAIDVTDFVTGNVTDEAAIDLAIGTIDAATKQVSSQRSELGAVQNRLEHTIANLDNAAENLQAAESRIRDVDMAHEMMDFTKHQILQQASTAMLAQANLAPQSILQLLG